MQFKPTNQDLNPILINEPKKRAAYKKSNSTHQIPCSTHKYNFQEFNRLSFSMDLFKGKGSVGS